MSTTNTENQLLSVSFLENACHRQSCVSTFRHIEHYYYHVNAAFYEYMGRTHRTCSSFWDGHTRVMHNYYHDNSDTHTHTIKKKKQQREEEEKKKKR